jgi:TPR repeat protein
MPGEIIRSRSRSPTRLFPETSSREIKQTLTAGVPPNWNNTLIILRTAADGGDAESQFVYANVLFDGRGVVIDRKQASRYFKLAAETGHIGALNQYADILQQGWGIPKDLHQAAQYFRRAAEAGHPESMYRWGKCLIAGIGTAKSQTEAARWFRQGADKSHCLCQIEFAKMAEDGIGMERDVELAYSYSQMAARYGNPNARAMCAKIANKLKQSSARLADPQR